MAIKLANCLNKTILITIPIIFEDKQPRSYLLVGIEPYGLWLQSLESETAVYTPEPLQPVQDTQTVFVPFSQIAYILDPSSVYLTQLQSPPPVRSTNATVNPERPSTPHDSSGHSKKRAKHPK